MPQERERERYCLWMDPDKVVHVGIVGTGPGFLSVLDIIEKETFQQFTPHLRLVAVAEPGPETEKLERVRLKGLPVYDSLEELITRHPELDLVVELTGRATLTRLRSVVPRHVSLIDHTAASFLCGLHDTTVMGTYYLDRIDRQMALISVVIDEIQEDILVLDSQMRIVDCNRYVCGGCGKSKADLVGRHCWEVQTAYWDTPFCEPNNPSCPVHETLHTGRKAESLQTRTNPEGRLLYFRVYAYPIQDKTGGTSHVLVMRRNITQRTKEEKGAQKAERLATIGEMSAFLAHEIRNPLFAIGGFANSLMRSPNLNQGERDKLKIILLETERLDKMLKSVLDFARPTVGGADEVDVAEVIDETVDLMKIGYCAQDINLDSAVEKDLPRVKGDADLFKQCLINLVKNSVEAMPDGGRITIRAGLADSRVRVEVEDNGPGMPKALLEKVFSPFFTTKDKGYGLGLAMIKKIVEDSEGRVELSSTEGGGTTVALSLAPVLASERGQKGDAPGTQG